MDVVFLSSAAGMFLVIVGMVIGCEKLGARK